MFERLIPMDIQFFADGALNTQATTTSSLAPEMKTYYEKRLIELATANLVHMQFADKYPIPRGSGKTIEFRKFTPLAKALTPLTEATVPTGNSLTVEYMTATIKQYGDYISQSDLLELTSIDNTIIQATRLLGNQAGETMDTVVREEIVGGSNVMYAPKVASDGTETAVTARYALDKTAKLTVDSVFTAAADLKASNTPYVDDGYVAIIHPHTERDLLRDEDFIEAVKYGRPEDLYIGEVGRIGNVRFVVSSEAKIFYGDNLLGTTRNMTCKSTVAEASTTVAVDEAISAAQALTLVDRDVIIDGVLYTIESATAGEAGLASIVVDTALTQTDGHVIYPGEGGAAGVAAYATMILGAGAYGATELEGGGLQHIVKQLGYADELNLRSATGWKGTLVAKRLVEPYMIRVEHCTSFSDRVTAAN